MLPPLLQMPTKPEPPVQKELPPPRENPPPEPIFNKSSYGFAWLFLFMGVILLYISNNSNSSSGQALLMGSIMFLVGVLGIYYGVNNNIKAKAKYEFEKKSYSSKLRLYKQGFKLELENYYSRLEESNKSYEENLKFYQEIEAPLYLEALNLYNLETKNIKSKEYIQTFRRQKVNEFLETVKKPEIHPASENIRKGVAEKKFLLRLKYYNIFADKAKSYKDKIHSNYTINFNKDSTAISFLPDITYYNQENGLCIDIEIDEPYVGSTGTPIHYIESKDYLRDKFFNENGWIVIRFAEAQVVNEPFICCKIIDEVIDKVLLTDSDQEKTKIKHIKRWTKDEAHQMAFKRYRNSYLGIELIEDLNLENHESTEQTAVSY